MHETWAALGRKLDEIEAEMRRIGYWNDHAPDVHGQRVPGKAASFMDAPSFELWLQTVFLPNARQALRSRRLPPDSQVGLMAMRQYDYHTSVPQAEHLTELLSEFDGLVRATPHTKRGEP